MKTLINKIAFLTVVFFSLSVSVWAALPENNSIMRFESNDGGKTISAVAMADGTVKPLAEGESGYIYENTLWLVRVSGTETFTLQNVGTGKYLNYKEEGGTFSAKKVSLLLKDSPITIYADANSKYYIKHTSWFTTNNLYIQYDPNTNVWMYYAASGTNKNNSQSSGGWSDETNPPANEEESVRIPGSEVEDILGNKEVNVDNLKENIDKVEAKEEDYAEFKKVLKADPTPIVVGTDSTYLEENSSYWKQSTIKITVNSSTWTPVSFPMDVKCVKSIGDVYVQTYNTEKRANGTKAWENELLDSSDVLKRGVAYNLATDKTPEITLEFAVEATDGVTIKNEVVSIVEDYSHKLAETTGNGLNRDKNWYYIGNALFLDAKMNNAIDYACQYKGSSYVPVDLEAKYFAPFSTFFVQYAGDYAMSSAKATRNSAPMLAKEKLVTEKYSLRIDGENSYYETGIYFADGASSEDYVVGEDFLSFATKKGKGVEIYTVEDDADYSFNKRPIENTVVRVGMYVGTAGRYTISLNNISGNAETFVLFDTYTQETAYLHLGEEYTFDSEKGVHDDRFIVTVTYAAPDVTTDNLSLSSTNIVVVANEIRGLVEGSDYFIYDTTGRLVYSAVAESDVVTLPFLNSGIYIVRNSNGWVKFIVK